MPSSVTPKQLTRLSWPARTPGKEKAMKVNIHRMSRTSAVILLSQVSLQIHLKRCNARSNHPFSLPWRTIHITTAISKNSTMRFLKTRTHNIASIFLSALTTTSFCPEDLLIPNQALYWVFFASPFSAMLSTISTTKYFQNQMWCLLTVPWIQELPWVSHVLQTLQIRNPPCIVSSYCKSSIVPCLFPLCFCFPSTHSCTCLLSQGLLKLSLSVSLEEKDTFAVWTAE